MAANKPGFVLIHGAWRGAHAWDAVLPLLEQAGFEAAALDLPGAGANAAWPARFDDSPSPNAGVTQEQRTEAVLELADKVAAAANGKVILVGHSLGGVTVSDAAEAAPERFAALVYVCAFLLPPGTPALAMIKDPLMQDALVPSLLRADPARIGAMRLDVRSEDPAYVAQLQACFAGDVAPEVFAAARLHQHCDEPAQVTLRPSPVTAERFGRLPRHYVRCSLDRAITPAGQDAMVARTDAALGSATNVHRLESSHAPYLSQPRKLAAILTGLA
jgi:pimeloyl-ACP methyl ester carboxylesterase